MRNPKRWIAALLTAVMLFSALPGAAFASEADEDGFQQEEQVAPAATPSEEEKSDFEAPPQDEDDLTSFISKDDDVYMLEDDTVTFNTQYMDIVVGHNVEKAEQGDTPYVLFADDGSYTIELYEEAPFFPYEVQFSYQGHTTSEWFMDENDCVIVGGHPFYVSCFGTPNHVGLLVSGEYVPAFPDQKEFVNDPYAAMPISLLPLREVSLSVDLKNYLPSELVEVGVNAVLTNQSITAGSAVVWAKGYRDDNFTVADMDAKLDLTPDGSYSSYVNLELIVGTADQLDTTNTRYIVSVEICSLDNLFAFNAYTTSGETLKVDRQYFDSYNGDPSYRLGIHEGTWTTGPTRLSMGWNSEFTGENGLTAVVYGGRYASEDELPQNGTVITDMWNASGASAHLADYSDRQNPPEFTLVLSRNGEIVQVIDFGIYMYVTSISISTSYCLYAESTSPYSTYRPQATSGGSRQEGNDYSTYVYTMWNGNPVNGSYYYNLSISNPDSTDESGGENGINFVSKAVVGRYTSEAAAADATDIKGQLFSDAGTNGGYKADYSGGVTFTIFLKNGVVRTLTVKTTENVSLPSAPTPLSSDTYFRMNGARKSTTGPSLSSYVMPYSDDSYYYNGYQTVFLLDNGSAVAENTTIYPTFYWGNKVDVHLGHNGESTTKQESGTSPVTFKSAEAIHYSAAAENGTHLKNYWVTFLTQQSGAHLFVNGATNADPSHCDDDGTPVREVFLDDAHGNHHDVFFANIGDASLTGLYVRLENAQNIKLDDYWTVREGSANASLAAFDSTEKKMDSNSSTVYYGELKNVAKVRLVPNGAGVIRGTLVIGSTGSNEEVTIKLTGTAGTPKITTTSIVDGVKYVPYSSVIQTNNMYASDAVRFERVAGTLPGGMYVKPNGEVYGVPQAAGTFTFTVRATYNNDDSLYDEKEFTLVIAENTDRNVYTATDSGYTVTETIGSDPTGNYHFVLDGYKDQVFKTDGELVNFIDLWLDGRKLTKDVDYQATSGSTVITIFGETLDGNDDGNGDTHTIAAEFREGDKEDGTLKRAAQNYVIEGVSKPSTTPTTPSNPGGSSNPGNNKPTNTSEPTDNGNPNDNTPSEPETETSSAFFDDVTERDWFYDDVKWAFESELMVGVSERRFAPEEFISQATIVTLLARMLKIDLTQFDGIQYDDILPNQWYTNAAIWAKQSGMLPDYSTFTGTDPLSRNGMAIMLVKYLRSMGVDVNIDLSGVVFEDVDLMTAEGLQAFQILYHYGIFRGVGGNRMDPMSFVTRAQFAALMHRISVFIESR